MTKLEEIARAICGQNPVINYDMAGNVGDVVRTIFLERARAVLSALKTPTPEMIEAGAVAACAFNRFTYPTQYSPEDQALIRGEIDAIWSAMIGAAVGDGR